MKDKHQTIPLFPDDAGEVRSGQAACAKVPEEGRKPRLRPVDRRQILLRPVNVEELIGPEHEARAIWAFVERLDKDGYYKTIQACEGVAGSPSIDPQVLISVWVYSYAKGISSAREIARLCGYDPAYQWLTGMQEINYHTLSDFRVKHQEQLNDLFVQILGLLSAEGLITLERVTQDGSKVRAYASTDTFRREGRIRAHLELAREQVQGMEDPRIAGEVGPRVAKARERAARERLEKLELALSELEKIRLAKHGVKEKEDARVSMTDPEARIMKDGGSGGYLPSYNMQISTDCANGVIVGCGVTQEGSDYNQLLPAEERIEEQLGRKPEQMIADGGFSSRGNVIGMSEREVDFYGSLDNGNSQSAGQIKRRGVDPAFYPTCFTYDEATDRYFCPAGKELRFDSKERGAGVTIYRYRARVSDCRQCPFSDKCCPQITSKRRSIVRSIEDPLVTLFREKMETEQAKAIYKQRGPIAEFSNLWLKAKIGLRQFRLRGLINAGIEVLWACITYNIKQWIRLRWRIQFAGAQ
jgi:transposase